MYLDYFGLTSAPFSIAPDPRFLYLSEHHKEALAHLLYGVTGQGGFVVLTGEVGTGKTTICRCFLEQLPANTDVAFIVNPRLSARELLASICDELHISYGATVSLKGYTDLISAYLLQSHAQGRHTAIIIDEAQNLRIDVLEQLRLLTNLETAHKKLLQIMLLGQPELNDMLARSELRQLSQRVTARYHLAPLSRDEVEACVRFRLAVAGQRRPIFSLPALRKLYRYSKGVPRLINLLCDRALLGAWAEEAFEVTPKHMAQARKEILGETGGAQKVPAWLLPAALGFAVAGVLWGGMLLWQSKDAKPVQAVHEPTVDALAAAAPIAAVDPTSAPVATSPEPVLTLPQSPRPLASLPDAAASEDAGQAFALWLSRNESRLLSGITPSLQALLTRWPDTPVTAIEDCSDLPLVGLGCMDRQGNWQSIRQMNRPVLLKLFNHQGQSFPVAVLRLQGEQALISVGGDALEVPVAQLDQLWLGEYTLVWRLPPFRSAMVQAGDIRDPDKWLAEQMNQVLDRLAPELTPAAADILRKVSLREKVRWFQKHRGLIADGIAGEQTYIQINSVLRPDQVPFLIDPAP